MSRSRASAITLSAVLVLLTALMQSLLGGLAENHTIYGGLHAFDGLVILGIAGWLYIWSRRPEA